MAGMLGRMAGAAIGAMFSRERHGDPVKGALIGAATMFLARRLLPARIAGIGATIAAGYVAKKLADREMARQDDPAPATTRTGRARRRSATSVAPNGPDAAAADRTVPPTVRSTKMPQGQRSSETA
jgi:hypothetical protein